MWKVHLGNSWNMQLSQEREVITGVMIGKKDRAKNHLQHYGSLWGKKPDNSVFKMSLIGKTPGTDSTNHRLCLLPLKPTF